MKNELLFSTRGALFKGLAVIDIDDLGTDLRENVSGSGWSSCMYELLQFTEFKKFKTINRRGNAKRVGI